MVNQPYFYGKSTISMVNQVYFYGESDFFCSRYPIKNIDFRGIEITDFRGIEITRRGTWDVRQERWDPHRRLDLKKDVEGSMDRSRLFLGTFFSNIYIYTRWCPPVISWFIMPLTIHRYIYHKS